MLAKAAASACMCDVVGVNGSNGLLFIGRAGDRGLAISIWRFLYEQALRLVKEDLKLLRQRSRMHPIKMRGRYLKGFATAIYLRLAREKEVVIAASGEAGIVRVHAEEKALEVYKADALQVRSRKLEKTRDSAAFRAGFARGAQTPLRKQHHLTEGE